MTIEVNKVTNGIVITVKPDSGGGRQLIAKDKDEAKELVAKVLDDELAEHSGE